jgi:ketosteroid isomerase-like protein
VYFDEDLSGAIAEGEVEILLDPPVHLRVADRFTIDDNGRIAEQENHFDPRDVTNPTSAETTGQGTELVEGFYKAIASGDVPAVLGALDDEVVWTEAAGFPYSGTYHGPQAVLSGVFARLNAEWDGFQAVPDHIVDGGEVVVGAGWYSGTYKATGKPMRARFAHVIQLSGGKITKFEQIVDTAKVAEALT